MKSYARANVVANDNNVIVALVRDNEERKIGYLDGSGSLSHPDCTVSHIDRQTAITTMVYSMFSGTH